MSEDRSREHWAPEPIFAGATVFVLGGGPSLEGFDFGLLRGRRVIAVNSAGHDAPFADVLLYMDNGWFLAAENRALVERFAGIVISFSRAAKAALPDKIQRVRLTSGPGFPAPGCLEFRAGICSGQTAVSAAITMGARRVILLGFDGRADEQGRTHYHKDRALYTAEHAARMAPKYATHFLPAWSGWNRDALATGCTVLNATPDSALREFPMITLPEALDLD